MSDQRHESQKSAPYANKEPKITRTTSNLSSETDSNDKYRSYLRASELSKKSELKTLLGDKMLLELPPEASGAITVTLYINENGKVDEVQVEDEAESSIDRAALDVIVGFVKTLEFEPGEVSHVAVKTRFKMELFL